MGSLYISEDYLITSHYPDFSAHDPINLCDYSPSFRGAIIDLKLLTLTRPRCPWRSLRGLLPMRRPPDTTHTSCLPLP